MIYSSGNVFIKEKRLREMFFYLLQLTTKKNIHIYTLNKLLCFIQSKLKNNKNDLLIVRNKLMNYYLS